jgi:hypothetical protein
MALINGLIGISPPPGSPRAAPIAMSVAGRKYHYPSASFIALSYHPHFSALIVIALAFWRSLRSRGIGLPFCSNAGNVSALHRIQFSKYKQICSPSYSVFKVQTNLLLYTERKKTQGCTIKTAIVHNLFTNL